MLYNGIKIAHIISATFVLMSMAYSFYLWRSKNSGVIATIQTQTWLVIVPFAMIQLLSGFTMISLQHEELTQLWIKGSVIGFVIAIGSWFGFIYFLLSSDALTTQQKIGYRRVQGSFLLICVSALLSMIFFMANKV